MRRPDLLAHSAPDANARPQHYEEHTTNVRRGARARAAAMLRFAPSEFQRLAEAVNSAALFHDLGKLDPETQAALARGRGAALSWDHIDAGVALLSASRNWWAAWLVRAHHAPGLPAYRRHFDRDELGRRLRGRRNDDESPGRHDAQIARTDTQLSGYLSEHESAVGSSPVAPMRPAHGLAMRLALSCLIDADHADTARNDTGFAPPIPPDPRWHERLERLDKYVLGLPPSGSPERDHHRRRFYSSCRDSNNINSIVACEGPVGIGKTTAITAYLLRRAAFLDLRRLVIVAPYTNIISQTVATLRRALVLAGENPEEVVVEHHHRADFSSIDVRELAVRWAAPIVVTTAVQFFETLGSNSPAQLRKLHALPGSAVFIDEAHAALPAHLWRQCWRWLRELAARWGCCFVLASGSLVRFWENSDIVDNPEPVAELLPAELKRQLLPAERRRIRYRSAGHFDCLSRLIDKVGDTDGPRLVIFNTVQSAAVFARNLQDAGHDVSHLSTALAPQHRSQILARVEERLRSEASRDWTLVATSCVEAGVGLSFRAAFRERFSAASIIQVGGRVNRHGRLQSGMVFDFTIDADKGITRHPGAHYPAAVLKRQLAAGVFETDDHDPAAVVTDAMAQEVRDRGGLGHDALIEAEGPGDYPRTSDAVRVIVADTRLVVVDAKLAGRLERRIPTGFLELLRGSVQIWGHRIDLLRLTALPGRREVYWWPYAYDAEFLGYMAGVLDQLDFSQEGFAII